jgi:hypothetical protein
MGMTKPPVDIEIIAKAVELACRAPSLHNSQPWRWTASDTVVELHADAHRVVRSHDSSGREALISCGVALDHFRTAMAAAGWNTTVEQFPNPDKLDHVASITFARLKSVPQDVRDRADAILHRRTDRLPFRTPNDWESFEPMLRDLADGDLATLDVLSDDARPELAEASRLTESLRRDDDFYHAELQWWTAFQAVRGCSAERIDIPFGTATGPGEPWIPSQRIWRSSCRDVAGPGQGAGAVDSRRHAGGRPQLRAGALVGAAGMHNGRIGDLPDDTHHRDGGQPGRHSAAHREEVGAPGFDPSRNHPVDRGRPSADTETIPARGLGVSPLVPEHLY